MFSCCDSVFPYIPHCAVFCSDNHRWVILNYFSSFSRCTVLQIIVFNFSLKTDNSKMNPFNCINWVVRYEICPPLLKKRCKPLNLHLHSSCIKLNHPRNFIMLIYFLYTLLFRIFHATSLLSLIIVS